MSDRLDERVAAPDRVLPPGAAGAPDAPANLTGPVVPAAPAEDAEPAARTLTGLPGALIRAVAAGVMVFALWQALRPLSQGSQYYLVLFLAGALPLVFLTYSGAGLLPAVVGARLRTRTTSGPDGPTPLDWVLAVSATAVCLYPVTPWPGGGYNDFLDRQGRLSGLDLAAGLLLLLLVLEAVRRTTGWVLPILCGAFLAFAYFGGELPQSWPVAHSGLDVDQIIDSLYNSGSGFFGTPLDVAGTYIVLFTVYGVVLEASGAGAFFVGLASVAFRRSRCAAARTTVAAGFLLGTVSGSGTATAVTVGSTTWPILRRAGYSPDQAAGMLAAAGVGAILSPPTLGAAAFIVAEYVGVSYLTVVGWALIPTLLYYLGILLAVELDGRKTGAVAPQEDPGLRWGAVLKRSYHVSSLVLVVAMLIDGRTVTQAVLAATALAFALSFLDREYRLTPRRVYRALSDAALSMLAVIAVCTAAGVITATTTKTSLGNQIAALVVDGAQLFGDDRVVVVTVTALLSALALTILGLAVPVTASFIIGWAVIGPALLSLDVPAPAVAMFVFYYSVLSEVTPPTALAAVGACAITGGRPIPAMVAALRYALPAFVVPLAFVISTDGEHLLGRGSWESVTWVTSCAIGAVIALALAAGPCARPTRLLALAATPLLLSFHPLAVGTGAGALAIAAALRRRRGRVAAHRMHEEKV